MHKLVTNDNTFIDARLNYESLRLCLIVLIITSMWNLKRCYAVLSNLLLLFIPKVLLPSAAHYSRTHTYYVYPFNMSGHVSQSDKPRGKFCSCVSELSILWPAVLKPEYVEMNVSNNSASINFFLHFLPCSCYFLVSFQKNCINEFGICSI